MKLKIFSLAIMAILAVSVTGIVVTEDSAGSPYNPLILTNQSGFFLQTYDYSTVNGRYLDLKVYDNNNNQIATYHSTFTHSENFATIILPVNTAYVDVDVAVWKTNSALLNGRWNHVFTHRLSGEDIALTYVPYNQHIAGPSTTEGNAIITTGSVYGSSAEFRRNIDITLGNQFNIIQV
jgi:hypothetical protein